GRGSSLDWPWSWTQAWSVRVPAGPGEVSGLNPIEGAGEAERLATVAHEGRALAAVGAPGDEVDGAAAEVRQGLWPGVHVRRLQQGGHGLTPTQQPVGHTNA